MSNLAVSFVPFLFFVLWLAVVFYLFTLARRLLAAAERMAVALERRGADRHGESAS